MTAIAVDDPQPTAPTPIQDPRAAMRSQTLTVLGARRRRDSLAEQVRSLRKGFDIQIMDVIQELERARAKVTAEEETLRQMALTVYAATQDKNPSAAVTIRETSRLEYPDQAAVDWAADHHLFIKLRRRAFEKFARSHPGEVLFVRMTREARANIVEDLSSAAGVRP